MRSAAWIIPVVLVLSACGGPEPEPMPQRRKKDEAPGEPVVAQAPQAEVEPEVEPEPLPAGEAAVPEVFDPDAPEVIEPKKVGVKDEPIEVDPDALMPTDAVDPVEADLAQAAELAKSRQSLDEQRLETAKTNRNSYEDRELPPDAPPLPELPKL